MSFDTVPYTDLTLFDVDSLDILAAARLSVQSKFPALFPAMSENSYESAHLEINAEMVASAIRAINRLPRAIVDSLLIERFGVIPKVGAAPTVTATLSVASTSGTVVQGGITIVELDIGDGSPVQFVLDDDVIVPAASTTGTGTFTAVTNTSKLNGIAAGTDLRLITGTSILNSVTTTSVIDEGVDPETIDEFRSRGVSKIRHLRTALVLADDFTDQARQTVGVERAHTIDTYDGAGGGAPYDDTGHVTVVVRGENGNVSAAVKAAVATDLQSLAMTGLAIHVIDPIVYPVDVTCSVVADAGSVAADVQQAVVDALVAYLDPQTWPWADTVYRNDLIALVAAVPGVARVVTVSVPAVDFVLSGDGPLVQPGAIAVSVT